MNFVLKYLAKLLAPHIESLIKPDLEATMLTIAHRATDAQLATDTLAEHLGYTVIVDSDSGTAGIHGITK
jgi:hypothetical protein